MASRPKRSPPGCGAEPDALKISPGSRVTPGARGRATQREHGVPRHQRNVAAQVEGDRARVAVGAKRFARQSRWSGRRSILLRG